MDWTDHPAKTIASGAAAGVGSGLLGVGGGIVMVPLLTGVLGFTQHRAHATSLAAIVPIGLVGATTFALHAQVDVAIALPMAVGTMLGAPLGARIMHSLREGILMTLFGALMLLVAVRMLVAG